MKLLGSRRHDARMSLGGSSDLGLEATPATYPMQTDDDKG